MAQTAKKENFIQWFIRKWKSSPIFSTGCVLVLMVILQTVALGFRDASFSAWLQRWGKNWINILRNNAGVGIVALGMTFVIISGGIDLAVGSTMTAVGAVLMVIINGYPTGLLTSVGITGPWAYVIGIAAALVVGSLVGVINGSLIAYRKLPPFLPILYWLVLALVLHIVSRHTPFGRRIYAIGSNERTARLSGIHVERVKTWIYILMGALVAVTAVIQVARIGSMDYANAGSGYEMDAIAAVVVGGTSMSGGKGSIGGTVLGMLIIAVMNNLLNLMGVPPFLREAFKGAIVIVAVLLQRKEK